MNPVRFAIPLVACLLVSFTFGCSGPQDDVSIADTPVLHIQLDGEPSNLDPAQANDEYGSAIIRSVFQRLYRYKLMSENYELIPELAAGPPQISDDLTRYQIQIRPGNRFSDSPHFDGGVGREVVASDFVYSIKRHFDPETRSRWRWIFRDRIVGLDQWAEDGADYDQEIAGLRAIDDYTLSIQLTAPFPPFLDIIATSAAAIVPREIVQALGAGFAREPIGSGAYVLSDLTSSGANLLANPNYQVQANLAAEGFVVGVHDRYVSPALDGSPLPAIKQIQLSFVVDALPSWLLLTDNTNPSHYGLIGTAAADMAFEDVDSLKLRPEFSDRLIVEPSQMLEIVRIDLNLDGPLGIPGDNHTTEDVRGLRCAMVKSMDWQSRNEIFYNKSARVFPGVIPPGLHEHESDQDRGSVTLDREGARQLLATHHWDPSNLPVIRFGIQAGVLEKQGFEHSRAMLMQLGWPSDKILADSYASFGDLLKASLAGKFDVLIHTWKLDYPDPENTLGLYFGPNTSVNFNRYQDDDFDAKYIAISSMPRGSERTEITREMNRMLIDDCLFIGSVARQTTMVWHKKLLARPREGIRAGSWWQFASFVEPG